MGISYERLAGIQQHLGHSDAAIDHMTHAVSIYHRMYESEPEAAWTMQTLAVGAVMLAQLRIHRADPADEDANVQLPGLAHGLLEQLAANDALEARFVSLLDNLRQMFRHTEGAGSGAP